MRHEELKKALRRLFNKTEVTDIRLTEFSIDEPLRNFSSHELGSAEVSVAAFITLANGGSAKFTIKTNNPSFISVFKAESAKEKIKKTLAKKKDAVESVAFAEELKKI